MLITHVFVTGIVVKLPEHLSVEDGRISSTIWPDLAATMEPMQIPDIIMTLDSKPAAAPCITDVLLQFVSFIYIKYDIIIYSAFKVGLIPL